MHKTQVFPDSRKTPKEKGGNLTFLLLLPAIFAPLREIAFTHAH